MNKSGEYVDVKAVCIEKIKLILGNDDAAVEDALTLNQMSLDSLDLYELQLELEDYYDIDLDTKEVVKATSVDALALLVYENIPKVIATFDAAEVAKRLEKVNSVIIGLGDPAKVFVDGKTFLPEEFIVAGVSREDCLLQLEQLILKLFRASSPQAEALKDFSRVYVTHRRGSNLLESAVEVAEGYKGVYSLTYVPPVIEIV